MTSPRMLIVARRIVGFVFGLYVLAVAVLFFAQRMLLFPAPNEYAAPRVSFAETFRGTRHGVRYAGLHHPSRSSDDLTFVYLHGNGEVVQWSEDLFGRLRGSAFGTAALEYSGYGVLHDDPLGEWPMLASVDAGLHALYERGVRPDRVVLLGRSLGSGFAVAMAARGHGLAIVLMSPYSSIPDAAAYQYPYVPARWLVRDRIDSVSRADRVHVPVLVVHGDRDEVVPFELGRRLAHHIHGARFIALPGAGHDDVFAYPSRDVLGDVVDFATNALAAREARGR